MKGCAGLECSRRGSLNLRRSHPPGSPGSDAEVTRPGRGIRFASSTDRRGLTAGSHADWLILASGAPALGFGPGWGAAGQSRVAWAPFGAVMRFSSARRKMTERFVVGLCPAKSAPSSSTRVVSAVSDILSSKWLGRDGSHVPKMIGIIRPTARAAGARKTVTQGAPA